MRRWFIDFLDFVGNPQGRPRRWPKGNGVREEKQQGLTLTQLLLDPGGVPAAAQAEWESAEVPMSLSQACPLGHLDSPPNDGRKQRAFSQTDLMGRSM